MKRILLILLLAIPSSAQLATQEATPIPVQSRINAASSLAFNSNVVSGHELFVAYECFSGSNCGSGPTIADTLTTTWTSRVTQGSTQCGNLWIWTGQAGSSGADTVTITNGGSFQNLAIMEVANVSNTLDVATTATGWSNQTTITSPSFTTNTNGAFIFTAAHTCNSGSLGTLSPTLPAVENSSADSMGTGWRIGGAAASHTTTFKWQGGSSGNVAAVAMKANTALTVVTTQIPNASTSAAYSFDLHANGGSGAYTWDITSGSLPLGLSLSSGGTISGTATNGNADAAITFRVTDGASATATTSLSIHVGTSFNTIAKINTGTGSGCGSPSIGTTVSGDLIAAIVTTAGGSSSIPKLTDTLSTTYSMIPLTMDMWSSSSGNEVASFLYWGFATSGGTNSVTCTGQAKAMAVIEFSNVQQTFDPDVVVTTLGSSASPYTSGSLSLPVSETILSWVTPFTSTATITTQSPYTAGPTITAGSTQTTSEYVIGASSGGNTASYAATSNTDGNWAIALTGFRPTTSGTAPPPSTGRKIRTQVY